MMEVCSLNVVFPFAKRANEFAAPSVLSCPSGKEPVSVSIRYGIQSCIQYQWRSVKTAVSSVYQQ